MVAGREVRNHHFFICRIYNIYKVCIFGTMITKFLSSYGFNSVHDLLLSLSPSLKYGQGTQAVGVSAVVAIFAEFMGFTPLIVIAMFLAVVVESVTGVRASSKQGQPFESWKFSRCVLKVFIWVALFFMFNTFKVDAEMRHGILWSCAATIYTLMQITTMVYFVVEYATSIAENLAILDGKPKDAYVKGIKNMFVNIVKSFTQRIGK